MERYSRIDPKKKSARMIASEFRKATGKSIDPAFVHWLADKKQFQKFHYGKETYYASNLRTVVDANYYTMYPIFLKEKEQKKLKREKPIEVDYDPDETIESSRDDEEYCKYLDAVYGKKNESIDRCIKNVINEFINRK